MSNNLFAILLLAFCAPTIFAINIITKAEWGAANATGKTFLVNGLAYAIIHHTAGAYCSTKLSCIQQMKNIQYYHQKSLGWDDIGYNFLIGGDGNIYEGRGWNVLGAHASNWNSRSIGISFMGNYNNDIPTSGQIAVAKDLLAAAVLRGQIKSDYILYGHRQVGATECPGNHLFNEIQTWNNWKAKKFIPNKLPRLQSKAESIPTNHPSDKTTPVGNGCGNIYKKAMPNHCRYNEFFATSKLNKCLKYFLLPPIF